MPGWQLANARERRSRRLRCPERKSLNERHRIQRPRCVRMSEQRFRLGCERESPAPLEQKQRSHAKSIASEKQLARLAIPDGECELSVEVRETLYAPLLVRVCEDLGIAIRREAMAERGQLVLKLRVVEDL